MACITMGGMGWVAAGVTRPAVFPGDRFGRLVVVEEAGRYRRERTFRCLCDCGAERVARGSLLTSGAVEHCGCLNRRRGGFKHGQSGNSGKRSPTYQSWRSMIGRCCYPSNDAYRKYGARGVTVCDRWRESFEAFLEDMGPRPEGKTLDRIDPDGHYEPGNCRWATRAEQDANKRRDPQLRFAA